MLAGCLKKHISKASVYTAVCHLVTRSINQLGEMEVHLWNRSKSTQTVDSDQCIQIQQGAITDTRAVIKSSPIFSLDTYRNSRWFQGLPRDRWQECFITLLCLMMICNEGLQCSHVGSSTAFLSVFVDCYIFKASCCELRLTTTGEVLQRTQTPNHLHIYSPESNLETIRPSTIP